MNTSAMSGRSYKKPSSFDRNMIVIGAGAAGLVTSYIAAAVKAKVTLIEANEMGGDCLNTGCVPSKALIRSAKIVSYINRAKEFGINTDSASVDFAAVMDRVHEVIKRIEPHDSVERYTSLGVEVVKGYAKVVSPYAVEVNGETLTARTIVIATGARPFVPPIEGLEASGFLTSDTVWGLRELPRRIAVLGGGPIGCELSQSFSRLGAEIFQIEMMPKLLIREDAEVADAVTQKFVKEGINVLTNHRAVKVERRGGEKVIHCEVEGQTVEVVCDEILVAVGRVARTKDIGLDELGIELTERGTIKVNEFLQTNYKNILACGDIVGPYQFTHVAGHQAWYAAVNGLFGGFKKFKVDYSVIPAATFTDPEVARVGINEHEAKQANIGYEVSTFGIDDLDRAIADSEAHGFIKVLTVPGKDKILGVTIVGYHAGELLAEYVLAMKHGLGLNQILGTIHTYPTLSEANKYVAGEWKRAHAPQGVLKWVERFHSWRRG